MPPNSSPDRPWWTSFFDDDYASYGLASTPPELLEQTVRFLLSTLELQPGALTLDQCSGIGRLGMPMAERGVRIIGVEQAATYVAASQSEVDRRQLPCRFIQGDAFEFVSPEPCDAAFNWFTSFGYSPDDAINIRMLQRVFESLKPGGRFVLDYMNLPRVFADFKESQIDRPAATALHGLIVMMENKPDFSKGMMHSTWTFLHPDGRRVERPIRTRLLMPTDFVRMFGAVGFEDVRLHGWIDGEPLTRLSRRCIVFGRKPGRTSG